MKRVSRILVGPVALGLSMCFVFSNMGGAGFEEISDADGGKLFGGGCVRVPSGNAYCNGDFNFKGCKSTLCEPAPLSDPGSFQPDTPKNCGVVECGTVSVSKSCGT